MLNRTTFLAACTVLVGCVTTLSGGIGLSADAPAAVEEAYIDSLLARAKQHHHHGSCEGAADMHACCLRTTQQDPKQYPHCMLELQTLQIYHNFKMCMPFQQSREESLNDRSCTRWYTRTDSPNQRPEEYNWCVLWMAMMNTDQLERCQTTPPGRAPVSIQIDPIAAQDSYALLLRERMENAYGHTASACKTHETPALCCVETYGLKDPRHLNCYRYYQAKWLYDNMGNCSYEYKPSAMFSDMKCTFWKGHVADPACQLSRFLRSEGRLLRCDVAGQ